MRRFVELGSRWIIGCGSNLNIWRSRWMPRPGSFRPVTPITLDWENVVVANFIDFEVETWRDQLVGEVFLPCDVET